MERIVFTIRSYYSIRYGTGGSTSAWFVSVDLDTGATNIMENSKFSYVFFLEFNNNDGNLYAFLNNGVYDQSNPWIVIINPQTGYFTTVSHPQFDGNDSWYGTWLAFNFQAMECFAVYQNELKQTFSSLNEVLHYCCSSYFLICGR